MTTRARERQLEQIEPLCPLHGKTAGLAHQGHGFHRAPLGAKMTRRRGRERRSPKAAQGHVVEQEQSSIRLEVGFAQRDWSFARRLVGKPGVDRLESAGAVAAEVGLRQLGSVPPRGDFLKPRLDRRASLSPDRP